MPTCTECGAPFTRNKRGRPAVKCETCRAKYGTAYKKLRAATKAAALGIPCRRCGRPMLDPEDMDLGHDDRSGAVAGWEHSACNRAAGAHLHNAQRRAASGRSPSARQTAALGANTSTIVDTGIRPGQSLPSYATRKGPALLSTVTGRIVRICTCDRHPEPHEVGAALVGSRCW